MSVRVSVDDLMCLKVFETHKIGLNISRAVTLGLVRKMILSLGFKIGSWLFI
mgnify:CR=1 FL=1